jgi:hypothetical protein
MAGRPAHFVTSSGRTIYPVSDQWNRQLRCIAILADKSLPGCMRNTVVLYDSDTTGLANSV